jgi:hypothetical protein
MFNGGRLMYYKITAHEGNKTSKTFAETKVCRARVAPIELINTLIDMKLVRVGDVLEAATTYDRNSRQRKGIYKGDKWGEL